MKQVVDELLRYHMVPEEARIGIREDYEERAAIYEYLAGDRRRSAELQAMHHVEVTMKKIGTRPARPPAPLRKAFRR